MITKRIKGLTSLDPVKSIPSNYYTEQQLSNDIADTIRMNADNRKTNNDIDDISKTATSSRLKVGILRENSPTFKRLVAVRIKLEKYFSSISHAITPSQQLISETPSYEKPSTAPSVNIPLSTAAAASQRQIESKTKPSTAPVDKITYEKTRTYNGNIKHKCSLEIWLPNAGSDDEDGNTSRTTSPIPYSIGNNSQLAQSIFVKSRQSSTMQFSATKANSEIKSFDEVSPKKSEPIVIPRVYHYEDYLIDQMEERPRSGKNGNTYKSDGNGSNKYIKRQGARSSLRTPSTNNTEETVQSTNSTLPMSSKNLLSNIKQNSIGSDTKGAANNSNSTMINELMRKYSMIKKSHQELTQPRLQLEKPYQDFKYTTHVNKADYSLPSPLTSDSASFISSDQSIITTKKLLSESLPIHPTEDYTHTRTIDRRLSYHRPSQSNIYHQTRLFSIANQLQHRQTSASMSNAVLPTVVRRKTEESSRSVERSKTLDVVFAISNDDTYKIPSRLSARPESPQNHPNPSNIFPRTMNGNEQIPLRPSRRPVPPPSHALRSEQPQQQTSQSLVQLVKYQNIQNTAQRYHLAAHSSASSSSPPTTTTDVSTNKVLVHLKYSNGGNTDRNCLMPE